MTNLRVITHEEQEENFKQAMVMLDKAKSYKELAQIARDTTALCKEAQATGDYFFSYNDTSVFWDKYHGLKADLVKLKIIEVEKLIEEYTKRYLVVRLKEKIFHIHIFNNKEYLDVKKELWAKCTARIEELPAEEHKAKEALAS